MINKLQIFIESRNITRYQLMKETGIAQRTAYDLCGNQTQLPSPDVLRKICNTYQIQPNDIMEWIPELEYKERFEKIITTTKEV